MRFRVFNKITKEMIYPDDDHNFTIDNHGLLFFITDDLQLVSPIGCYYQIYIGVNDPTDKDIYEGDIIQLSTGERGVVIFHEGSFSHTAETTSVGIPYWGAVIGNIYENPELIKEISKKKTIINNDRITLGFTALSEQLKNILSEENLQSCPFCGEKDILIYCSGDSHYAYCSLCGARSKDFSVSTPESTIKKYWNRRAYK